MKIIPNQGLLVDHNYRIKPRENYTLVKSSNKVHIWRFDEFSAVCERGISFSNSKSSHEWDEPEGKVYAHDMCRKCIKHRELYKLGKKDKRKETD